MTESLESKPVVAVVDVQMRFGSVAVLKGCSLCVLQGETHAVLGQNGAGKSTLVKILNGVHPSGSYTGEIRIRGEAERFKSPAQARTAGIGYVPQEIEVIERLSVLENIFVGQLGPAAGSIIPWRTLNTKAQALLDDLGLPLDPSILVAELSPAKRHLVMVARALAAKPAVLILDEPTASLSEPEIHRLFEVLRGLKARGLTMVYITHRLPEVLDLCDRASVLRDGIVAAEFERGQFSVESLVSAMVGTRVNTNIPKSRTSSSGRILLKLDKLKVKRGRRTPIKDVSLELRSGEILGIAGILGSGRSTLLNAIYGHASYQGTVSIQGKEFHGISIRQARSAGVALLTEDRKGSGLLFNLPAGSNITIGRLWPVSTFGIISHRKEHERVDQQMSALRVKAASANASVAHLSGGNQQKLLLGRALLCAPKILLLDEPTKGVDVATRMEIYRLIVGLASEGIGVIVVSSDLDEVIALADRCLVMAEGHIVDEFLSGEGSEERVLQTVARAQLRNGNIWELGDPK